MKISLDQSACVGCGLCVQISPEHFSLNEELGTAQIQRAETEDDSVREAQASCPIGCICFE